LLPNSAANPLPIRCQSAADRMNSAAGGLGHIVLKPLIYIGSSVLGGHFAAAERRFSPAGRGIPESTSGGIDRRSALS